MMKPTLPDLIGEVVAGLRDFSPRPTVELGVIHGFCVDAARQHAPTLVTFLSSVDGLQMLSSELSKMPDTITAVGVDGAEWRFVDKT